MYLHKVDRELLNDIITTVSERSGLDENIVEKDYYVTMILKELAESELSVVFKGGTSLSKAYHVIDRFSEDIDITFEEYLGEARRKRVKYQLLKTISDKLELSIDNWSKIESDKDYNHYDFSYDSLIENIDSGLRPYVKLETALMTYAYPTEKREITSIIYEHLKDSDPDIIEEFGLSPFMMRTQSLERTFVDKLFAICDYYMNNKATRNSRHLYDIYKLRPYITIDGKFRELVDCVRENRSKMDIKITPSAGQEVDLAQKAKELITNGFYRNDYENSTSKLISDQVGYGDVEKVYLDVMKELFG